MNLESIERKDVLKFAAFLKNEKGQSPRSVHSKFACLVTFLSASGMPKLVGKKDRPKFVKQEVEIYENGDLEPLFSVCSRYHLTLYKFLLMTGLRERMILGSYPLETGVSNCRFLDAIEWRVGVILHHSQ